jgi:hypothetical protein
MINASDIIWQQKRYDGGWYLCQVAREGERGRLTVYLVGLINHVIHEEMVKCERSDQALWRTRCEQVINDPDIRERVSVRHHPVYG